MLNPDDKFCITRNKSSVSSKIYKTVLWPVGVASYSIIIWKPFVPGFEKLKYKMIARHLLRGYGA